MRSRIAVLTLLLCFYLAATISPAGGAGPAAAAAEAGAPAQMTPENVPEAFFPEPRHTFKAVFDGTVVLHSFVLQNRGKAALEVKEVKTG
jgi:hypothetical protein